MNLTLASKRVFGISYEFAAKLDQDMHHSTYFARTRGRWEEAMPRDI